ncbi:MarR family winged helix-turn-helix transcriptional regulator [Desulfosporosinus sp. BICA1-9]|uniref:MarR family winged helix-turn-helix transcriptional regulator n=1 Tax=Desulfosporosinus sp. BICA1-9 TaxID=1531958 RepID=UPI00054B41ED|nr:MarR family transcriptional regulator [Desulfosporosinus sp. BICA1-9]KJS46511.1 MAG: MarR family transcriptional regulator [Peptococcaceae bacterium BRH_c23]KJS78866.1 MAG: MarR family transcriptional regulator [Desulfosporosinus sp. BICA1-9]HBW38876.1 MarR family transcriptional regulator [Desulfosporosinus sp.]
MTKEKEAALMEETDQLFRAVWKKYQYYLMPETSDLSMHQMMFLKYLERCVTCTPSDIAQQFGITLGAVTGFVDRLYKLGLITRTRSEEDRRVVIIQLSPQGIEPLKAFEEERKTKLARIFKKLEIPQVAELNKVLEQLNLVLDDLASSDKK